MAVVGCCGRSRAARARRVVAVDEEPAVRDGDGADHFFAERIGGEEFEFRGGAEDEGIAALIDGIEAVAGADDRRPVLAGGSRAFEAFLPDDGAGGEAAAFGESGIGQDIEVAVVDDG